MYLLPVVVVSVCLNIPKFFETDIITSPLEVEAKYVPKNADEFYFITKLNPLDTLDTSPNSGHNHKNITYIFVGVRLLVANFIQQNFYITLFS